MERTVPRISGQSASTLSNKAQIGAITIGFLYFGKPILLPLALAIFLALVLMPLVTVLHRRHVPRTISVVLVVFMVAVSLSAILVGFSLQLTSLIDELPSHTENIRGKLRNVRGLGEGGLVGRLDHMWSAMSAEWQLRPETDAPTSTPLQSMPVDPAQVDDSNPPRAPSNDSSWVGRLPDLLGPVLHYAVAFGLALALAFFILLREEALRSRIVRFVDGSLIVTTKAVDDARERIGSYLRMQLAVNLTYGTIWGLGLYFIGLEYAAFWGFIAAVLRFVPYIGPWIAGLLPLTLALAQFPGWTQFALILVLLMALELVSNNVMEPMFYGKSAGVSEVAMLLSAAFWTFVWGPVGLMLSGPITVCLVVIGKHFPQVSFLNLLLGNDSVLEPQVGYYQRLVARDQDEATRLVLAQTKVAPLDQIFDELLIPALNLIKQDRLRADATEADERYVVETTREIIEDLAAEDPLAICDRNGEDVLASSVGSKSEFRIRVMGFPARDAEDQLALEMLRRLLNDQEWDFEIRTVGGSSTGEWVDRVAECDPAVVCVASLPPGGLAHTRYVCKKLRSRLPDMRIIVGRWGLESDFERDHEHLETVGADQIASTLRETRDQLNSWMPVFAEKLTRAPVSNGVAAPHREGQPALAAASITDED